ncbi:MAG: diguanylate cyclase [Polyangiaceae bacterium]
MGDDKHLTETTTTARVSRAPDDRMASFRRVLAALMKSDVVERGDVATALGHLTEISADVLHVERASVWRLSTDKTELVCTDLFERFTDRHMSGTVLRASDKPRYFAALLEERSIAAHDAVTDPRTSEFADAYLGPLGISSMLDAPIILEGSLIGVVCHEHVGPPRAWQEWEELVASSLADFVSMIIGAARLKEQAADIRRNQRELERREAEASVKRSAGGLRSMLDLVPSPILLLRAADAEVLTLNRRAKTLLGYYDAGLSGREVASVFADDAERSRMVAKFKAGNTMDRFEAELRRKDGTSSWATVTAQATEFEGEPALIVALSDLTEQKRLEARVTELESKDPLTGTVLRAKFLETAEDEVARASHSKQPLSFAIVDADRLKQLNGVHGLSAGDEALGLIAEAIFRGLREIDTAGRYAGAQLCVLMPECPRARAVEAMEKVRSLVEAEQPERDGAKLPVTVSIGVVELQEDEKLVDLLKRAEEAVRNARAAGGNRVVENPVSSPA